MEKLSIADEPKESETDDLKDKQPEVNILLDIFPEEVWLIILDMIQDQVSLLNCAKASPYLEYLLEPKRTTYLFAEVLKILDQQKYLTSKQASYLLQCRQVCRSWKQDINNFLELRPYHFKFSSVSRYFYCGEETRNDPAFPTWFHLYKFKIDRLENEILAEMSNPLYQENNPFPSRHVNINEGDPAFLEIQQDPEMIQRFRTVTEQFLEKVGHHIWHVRINLRNSLLHWEWYTLLRKFVQLMPNLRSLYSMRPPHSFREVDFEELDIMVRGLPFPTLNNLKLISFERAPRPAVAEILSTNRHVKVIEICEGYYDNDNLEGVPGEITGNLNPDSFAMSIISSQDLQSLRDSWRLQVLKIDFDDFQGNIAWSDIFRKLDAYKDTLTELYLDLPKPGEEVGSIVNNCETSKVPLNLVKLKRLEIQLRGFCTLDFLLGMTSLEYLKIRTNRSLSGGRIEFNEKIFGNFLECNIWNLIPSLKQVELSVDAEEMIKYRRAKD